MPRTSVVENNTINRTTDYSQFELLEANREQSRGHIETLKKAFEEVGNLTRVQPILVNDQMQIIDGQHRFTACRELGLPIYYTTVPGLGVSEARSMNILHRNWNMDDFAKSYATSGDTNYRRYITLREDYGFSHSIMLAALFGHTKGVFKDFREGRFVLNDEPSVRNTLDFFAAVAERLPFKFDEKLAHALVTAMSREGFDKAELLKKLEMHTEYIHKQVGSTDYLRDLEEVYNFKKGEANRVRLF